MALCLFAPDPTQLNLTDTILQACGQVLRFGGANYILGRYYFCFYYMFKTNSPGHSAIPGGDKIFGGHCVRGGNKTIWGNAMPHCVFYAFHGQ